MCIEIEAKLKVDSLQDVESRLADLGARFKAQKVQKDVYFDNPDGTLAGSDRCLRLRHELSQCSERVFLTYKGAKLKDNFKKRQEVELEITDADSAKQLLSALGYQPVLLVEKKRQMWQLGNCIVALDELPLLGTFVEIEGPDDQEIAALQDSLGLGQLTHIAQSYACLACDKLRELGCEKRELLL
jgi:adenylate cyclase class 2